MLVLLALWLVSASAAFVVADFLAEDRAERVAATCVVWTSLVVLPMYVLGLTNTLTRTTVAATTVGASAIAVLAVRRLDPARFATVGRRLVEALLLPLTAIKLSARRHPLLAFTLVLAELFFGWQLVTALLAGYFGDWDALWYHEPLIAWMIQNHGFRVESLPNVHQVANGYSRLCEVTQTWFALWGGRQMVDVTNFMFVPLLVASTYGLARRFIADRAIAIALGVGMFLLPGVSRLLRSTMMDAEAGALLLATCAFVSHPELTKKRSVLFVLAATLAVGSKMLVYPTIGVACIVFAVRLLLQHRSFGLRWSLGLIVACAAYVGAMVAVTHVRNFIHFHNPLWPLTYKMPALGIDWRGVDPAFNPEALRQSHHLPLGEVAEKAIAKPYTVNGAAHIWHVDDYGFGMAFVVAPLAMLACALAPLVWLGTLGRRMVGSLVSHAGSLRERWLQRRPASRFEARAGQATLLSLFAYVGYATSHATHIPRFTIAAIAIAVAVVSWLFSLRRGGRDLALIAFTMQLSAAIMTYWADSIPSRAWVLSWKQMAQLVRTPSPLREVSKVSSAVYESTGLARERELGPGDVVGYDESILLPGFLWNNAFSNRCIWLDDRYDPLGQAERLGAKWVATGKGTLLARQVAAAPERWELVGSYNGGPDAYRRR